MISSDLFIRSFLKGLRVEISIIGSEKKEPSLNCASHLAGPLSRGSLSDRWRQRLKKKKKKSV